MDIDFNGYLIDLVVNVILGIAVGDIGHKIITLLIMALISGVLITVIYPNFENSMNPANINSTNNLTSTVQTINLFGNGLAWAMGFVPMLVFGYIGAWIGVAIRTIAKNLSTL